MLTVSKSNLGNFQTSNLGVTTVIGRLKHWDLSKTQDTDFLENYLITIHHEFFFLTKICKYSRLGDFKWSNCNRQVYMLFDYMCLFLSSIPHP